MKNLEKNLNLLSAKELGQLFPIILTEYNPEWPQLYEQEKNQILEMLSGQILRIHHIGSTSIPNLISKPTIDILIEIRNETNLDTFIECMESLGYYYSNLPQNPPPFLMFMKGYSPQGYQGQAYHVHLRYLGDWDQLYFRDYLILHPEVAKQYVNTKIKLQQQYVNNRDAYTEGKTAFIKHITLLAREELGPRYRITRELF